MAVLPRNDIHLYSSIRTETESLRSSKWSIHPIPQLGCEQSQKDSCSEPEPGGVLVLNVIKLSDRSVRS